MRATAREALEGKWNDNAIAYLPILFITGLLVALSVYFNDSTPASAGDVVSGWMIELGISLVSFLIVVPLTFGYTKAMWKQINGHNDYAMDDMWRSAEQNYGFSIGVEFIQGCIAVAAMFGLMILYIIAIVVFSLNSSSTFTPEMIQSLTADPMLLTTDAYAGLLGFVGIVFVLLLAICIVAVFIELTYSMTIFIRMDNPTIGVLEAMKASRKMMQGHKWQLFVLQLTFLGWGLLVILTGLIGLLWYTPYIVATTAVFYEEIKPQIEIPIEAEIAEELEAAIAEETIPTETENSLES